METISDQEELSETGITPVVSWAIEKITGQDSIEIECPEFETIESISFSILR